MGVKTFHLTHEPLAPAIGEPSNAALSGLTCWSGRKWKVEGLDPGDRGSGADAALDGPLIKAIDVGKLLEQGK
jgi:hypothetical protein